MTQFSEIMKVQVLAYLTAKYEFGGINIPKGELVACTGLKIALFDEVVARHRYLLNVEGAISDNYGSVEVSYNSFCEDMTKTEVKNLAIDIFMS